MRNLPKSTFQKKVRDKLFEILAKSDDYLQITEIINQLNKVSSGILINTIKRLQSKLYIMVTLGKKPGECYIQGDSYIQVSFKLHWKLLNNLFYVEIQ